MINQTGASVNGTITFPAGADMSWVKSLKDEKFSSKLAKKKDTKKEKTQDKSKLPASAKSKIKSVEKSKDSAVKKADKIIDVYENYLYSLAPEAFDKYEKVKKEYEKNPKLPDMQEELNNAEAALSKQL